MCVFQCASASVCLRVHVFKTSASFHVLHSPDEDPVMRQFGDEVANEENLFAELQTASGIDQIITENEKLISEK